MDKAKVLGEFNDRMRRNGVPDGPTARIERVGEVVRQTTPDGSGNYILWSGLDERTADAAIAEQVRYFTSLGQDVEWKLYSHDQPADLGDRLRAAGFVPEEPETLMVARIHDLPVDVPLPAGVHLRPVTTPADVDLVMDVHDQAFGTDGSRIKRQLLAQLAGQPDTVFGYLAMAGDTPVSSARMELYPGTGFAGLWGGGTVEAWRGKGIYRALIAHRTRLAAERGYEYLQVDASDQSRPILQRLGFAALSVTTPYMYGVSG